MMWTYIPPSKWWRREYRLHLSIPLWPKWLAQRICKHVSHGYHGQKKWAVWHMCSDCHKLIEISPAGIAQELGRASLPGSTDEFQSSKEEVAEGAEGEK